MFKRRLVVYPKSKEIFEIYHLKLFRGKWRSVTLMTAKLTNFFKAIFNPIFLLIEIILDKLFSFTEQRWYSLGKDHRHCHWYPCEFCGVWSFLKQNALLLWRYSYDWFVHVSLKACRQDMQNQKPWGSNGSWRSFSFRGISVWLFEYSVHWKHQTWFSCEITNFTNFNIFLDDHSTIMLSNLLFSSFPITKPLWHVWIFLLWIFWKISWPLLLWRHQAACPCRLLITYVPIPLGSYNPNWVNRTQGAGIIHEISVSYSVYEIKGNENIMMLLLWRPFSL